VSLSDITQFIGTSSVPVVVAGTVLGVFELGEKLASQPAKDALSKWLLTFDVRKAGALPNGTREIFEWVFGKRHFSTECFIRSALFSLGAMVVVGIIMFLISPAEVLPPERDLALVLIALWLPWSILIDYVSLFKTRLILDFLIRIGRTNIFSAVIVFVDYVLYRVIFAVGMAIVAMATFFVYNWQNSYNFSEIISYSIHNILFNFIWTMPLFVQEIELPSVFFWSGFAPSIWMWLYVLALFVTRALLRSERIVNWLRWFLDVEKNPFRSIGAVAAALAFIASVAIILVSAEVSRVGSVSHQTFASSRVLFF
jgi:hypothetical protein